MALTDPYKRLLDLIDEWLAHKDNLVKLGYQTGRHSGDIPSDLTQVLEEENDKIAQLSTDIKSAADQVIRSPLSLLERHLSGPCDENLQYARQSIAEGEIVNDCEECEADDCEECERVRYLLELSESCAAADRGEFCLFLAAELNRKGFGNPARAVAKHALKYIPLDDHQLRLVAYLSQGNFCAQVGTGRSLYQARQVYTDALGQLSILYTRVEAGYRKKARAFEALKDGVERCLAQIKTIPSMFKAIPIVGEITAGKRKITPDEITGFIQQTDEREFQMKKQLLKTKPLGKTQITFAKEYRYVAMQVSGDSMNRADISPGDYVLLRRAKTIPLSPSSGDIVAIVFHDEDDNRATLKRILIESNKVTLKPESSNPKHAPRSLPPEAFVGDNPSAAIVGIAIAVLKSHPLKTP